MQNFVIMQIHFDKIFHDNQGRITPLVNISIGGVNVSPGATMSDNIEINGVNIAQLRGKILEVEIKGIHHFIVGYYK